ncbi:MAG: ATP-binding protein [Campylobacterota bacterium]|nr:ATP-binding protein [Campylobacterota bacterium]
MKTHYHSIYSNFEKLANTVFHGYINKPDIIEKVKNNKRDELYNILKPSYRYLSSVNFKQLHFHTKENISFLRMHKPDKYGDDLTNYRYSINYANTNKQFIAGLEMGRIVPGFRFVYPLFDTNNIHIGSVETSFSVKAFSLKLQELYEVRTNFIIEKALAKKELFDSSSDNFMESIESDKYLALKQTIDPKILKNLDVLKQEYKKNLQKKIKTQLDNNKVFSINAYVNDYPKVITFLPLKDIENRYIGYFVIYRNSDQIKEYSKQLTNKYILSFIFILGLFSFVLREYLHKQNLKDEVDIKTKKLQEVAVKLEVQTEELEELNVSLENRIQLEVDKNTKQERELFQQSKQAALGDMIGNIAHQWRQPLSAISTSASGMQLTHYAGMLKDEDFIDYTDAIINNAKYLSQTIDDFRDFIKSDKKNVRFNLSESIEKCMAIVNSSINNHNLNIQINVEDDLYINNYENELQQAIINIFSNAKDALKDNQIDSDDRIIFIDAHKVVDKVNIVITDTAGGIDENILEKIFEPYFTTKHQSQGTGLGLYMTHQIIIESMKGAIFVENSTFEYNNKTYTGAKFTIEFNLA